MKIAYALLAAALAIASPGFANTGLPMPICKDSPDHCPIERNADTPEQIERAVREREDEDRRLNDERAGNCVKIDDDVLECFERLPRPDR